MIVIVIYYIIVNTRKKLYTFGKERVADGHLRDSMVYYDNIIRTDT